MQFDRAAEFLDLPVHRSGLGLGFLDRQTLWHPRTLVTRKREPGIAENPVSGVYEPQDMPAPVSGDKVVELTRVDALREFLA